MLLTSKTVFLKHVFNIKRLFIHHSRACCTMNSEPSSDEGTKKKTGRPHDCITSHFTKTNRLRNRLRRMPLSTLPLL